MKFRNFQEKRKKTTKMIWLWWKTFRKRKRWAALQTGNGSQRTRRRASSRRRRGSRKWQQMATILSCCDWRNRLIILIFVGAKNLSYFSWFYRPLELKISNCRISRRRSLQKLIVISCEENDFHQLKRTSELNGEELLHRLFKMSGWILLSEEGAPSGRSILACRRVCWYLFDWTIECDFVWGRRSGFSAIRKRK